MYKISVPIINTDFRKYGGEEKVLEQIKKLGADRVFLACGEYVTDNEIRKGYMDRLQKNCAFLKKHGFEVGVWNWSTWYTGEQLFTAKTVADGRTIGHACPADPNFQKFAGEYMADFARCGVDIILLDDDFKFGFYGGIDRITCTCKHHMQKINDILGEELSPEELERKAMCGGKNKYRSAWMKSKKDSLLEFAETLRRYTDTVNPDVRIGLCAEMSIWDNDGIDAATLSRVLAGNTKPLLRLIGAPYWAVDRSIGNCRLQHVIELERMERSWCGDGIEIIAEGDVYPRPRHYCPSAYLELFDMAMRADGTTDGILKYALDYYSTMDYEQGYIERHCKNKLVYDGIEKIFAGKTSAGVRVYEQLNKLENANIPKEIEGGLAIENIFFSPAAKMLADASIPTTYQGEGVCSVAFGENIKYVPDEALKRGIIIDASAAKILMEKGIDVGIISFGEKKCSRWKNILQITMNR